MLSACASVAHRAPFDMQVGQLGLNTYTGSGTTVLGLGTTLLSGSLPTELALLKDELRYLDLKHLHVEGTLPAGPFPELQVLHLEHARPQAGRRRAGHEPQPPVASIAPPRVARRLAQDLEPAADLRGHRAEALALADDADHLTLEVRLLAQAPAPVDGPRGQPVVGLGLVEVRVAVVLVRDGCRGPV